MDRMFKKQKKAPSKSMKLKQQLYKQLKDAGIKVDWKHATINSLEKSLSDYTGKMEKIYNFASRNFIRRNDTRSIHTINSLPNRQQLNMSINQFNRIINNIHAPETRYLLVHIKDEYGSIRRSVSLNNKHFSHEDLFISVEEGVESDADYIIHDLTLGSVTVEWLSKQANQAKRSEFFRYFTNEYFSLKEFQVYTHGYDFKSKTSDADIPCFLYALMKGGVEESKIEAISTSMYSYAATHHQIKTTAESFELYIILKTYNESGNTFKFNTSTYGTKTDNPIELACVGQHLFAIKQTKVSEYALKHTQFASHLEWPSIRVKNGRVVKNGNPKLLMSHNVIGHLYFHRETMLTPITLENAPCLLNNKYNEVKSLTPLALNDRWFKSIGLKKTILPDGEEVVDGEMRGKEPFTIRCPDTKQFLSEEFDVVYFDLETMVDIKSNIQARFPDEAEDYIDGDHIPYLVAWKINNQETQYAFGLNCVKTMLESLPPSGNYLMFAHNAGFDSRFVIRHLTSFDRKCGIIEAGSKMKQLIGSYNGRQIVIKDTMSFIASALSELPSMFPNACNRLTLEKESFPHELMNVDSFDSMICLDLIKEEFNEAEILIENATKIDAIKDNTIDIKKYAIHYCKRDVDVLFICFERFRDMFKSRFKQDVYNHISMPGLAYAILHNEGCYDNCYSQAGPSLAFIRSAIVGGRCMTRDNKKHHTKHEVVDFDAVSLYPSAMKRLGESSTSGPRGFPIGKPKIHKTIIPKCDYHISRVKITKITKDLHFPLQSVKNGNESRDFTNDLVGKILTLDQYALEDLVEYQGVEYEVIEGLYWNSGFNNQILTTIESLFQERLKLKKAKNPLQNGIKLLMNASYGKLIQKPIVKSKTIVRGDKAIEKYTLKRINRLIQRVPISKDLCLFEEHKALYKHFSAAHLGVQILSMSKRIMNEVMCLSESMDLRIWYQDTDSIHIDRIALPQLREAFNAKYNRELVGTELGQFHSDFELKGAEGDVYATESYFISKKTYVDFLACSDNDTTGIHKRMKGIPSKLITDPRATYEGIYNGVDQAFDLTTVCPLLINNKNQRVMKRSSFARVVRAPKE